MPYNSEADKPEGQRCLWSTSPYASAYDEEVVIQAARAIQVPFDTTLYHYESQAEVVPAERRLSFTTPPIENDRDREEVLIVPQSITVKGEERPFLRWAIIDTDTDPKKNQKRTVTLVGPDYQMNGQMINVGPDQFLRVSYSDVVPMQIYGVDVSVIGIKGNFDYETGQATNCEVTILFDGTKNQWEVGDLPLIPVYEGSTIRCS